MYDLAVPNGRVGTCEKCRGSGVYSWGGSVNGKARFTGQCHSCQGFGTQTTSDINRNKAYNRFKLRTIAATR